MQRSSARLSQPVPQSDFAAHWLTLGACRELNRAKRQKLLALTAASGDLENLKIAVTAAGLALASCGSVLAAAAAANQLIACWWLVQNCCPINHWDPALSTAAGAGRREACEWLLANGARWSGDAVSSAAKGGHIELARFLMGMQPAGYGFTWADVLPAAAEGCDLATLQTLWADHRPDPDDTASEMTVVAAARSLVQWEAKVRFLLDQGCWRTDFACAAAAAAPGALERLRRLRELGFSLTDGVLDGAAGAGNTEVVRYLLAEGLRPAIAQAARLASLGGHLETLQALHAGGCPMGARFSFSDATSGGSLPVAAWLLDTFGAQAVGPDPSHYHKAAVAGSVAILELLYARGVPWSSAAWVGAADGGCEAVLEWLAEKGCPMPEDGEPYLKAAMPGDLATLATLRRLGCPFGPNDGRTFTAAVRDRAPLPAPLPALCWLAGAGCPIDWAGAAEAAQRREDAAGVLAVLEAERARREAGADVDAGAGAGA